MRVLVIKMQMCKGKGGFTISCFACEDYVGAGRSKEAV